MPRNHSRAAQLDTSTQAIVPSEQSHLMRSDTNCRKYPGKTTKPRGSYLPEPKILRIQQRYIAGENKTAIAKAEGCDRETVTRIVKFPEVQQFIAQMQQEFFGLVPDAVEAVRHALGSRKIQRLRIECWKPPACLLITGSAWRCRRQHRRRSGKSDSFVG